MTGRLSARVVGVVAVTGIAVAGAAVAFAWPDASTGHRGVAAPVPPAAKSAVRTVALGAAPGASGRRRVDLPARDTKPFSMVGITWDDPAAALRGTAQVRARGAGGRTWSPWLSLETDNELGPDTAGEAIPGRIRGATAPQWVGPSDGVQVRVVAATGKVSDALPAGLRLELVDPGDPPGGQGGGTGGAGGGLPGDPEPSAPASAPEPAPSSPAPSPSSTDPAPSDSPSTGPVTSPSSTPSVTPSATPPVLPSVPSSSPTSPTPRPTSLVMPPVVSRAAWRADESLNRGAPSYGTTINAVFVHHTDTTNAYTCAESPAIVRGIHAYDVRSNGWADIGYNYLVDKCGTLFEGRKGGVERPVIGAHTYGFNINSIGVVVIGTYIDSGVPAVVQSVLANLSAYRLGQYGHDPAGKVNLVALAAHKFSLGAVVTMNRISGHRDGDATKCPGDALYAQLAAVREEASGWVTGLVAKPLSGGSALGTGYYARGSVTLSWSVATPSAQLSRFEVLVDGRVASTVAADVRTVPIALTPGRHAVAVRALHIGGPAATSAVQYVVSDTAAPTFPVRPELSLRGGTVSTASVPVTLSWRAADNAALRSVTATAPAWRTFPANATGWAATARPGRATTWRLLATDAVGYTAQATVSRTPVLLAETSARKSGRWTTRRGGGYLGGRALVSASKKATLTWTFAGRSVALIGSVGKTAGRATVYVDGRKVATVNLKAGRTADRQAVWTRTWAGSGRHTVKIVVAAARPGVTTDGLAYVR